MQPSKETQTKVYQFMVERGIIKPVERKGK